MSDTSEKYNIMPIALNRKTNTNTNMDVSYKKDLVSTIHSQKDDKIINYAAKLGSSKAPTIDEDTKFIDLQSKLNEDKKKIADAVDTGLKTLYRVGLNTVSIGAGRGADEEQIVNNYAKFDRFGINFVMHNYLRTGYLFMTRPCLNLTFPNLKMHRKMNLLNTNNPLSMQFAIRAYLDTRFARDNILLTAQCPFIDYRNPFMTLVTNHVTEFTGGPSYSMEVFTDQAGYYGESQSMAIGSDSFKKPFDIQLGLIDPIGGPLDALFQFWLLYIELINTGIMVLYPDQQFERILNYTVSFYRFIMDPSFRFVRKMAKYTGCFPISHPGASVFDFSRKDIFVEGLRKFTVTFKCGSGKVDVDDPIIAQEFNTLVERYFPPIRCLRPGLLKNGIDSLDRSLVKPPTDSEGVATRKILEQVDTTLKKNGLLRNPLLPEFNYTGVPYLIDTPDGLRLDVISQATLSKARMIGLEADQKFDVAFNSGELPFSSEETVSKKKYPTLRLYLEDLKEPSPTDSNQSDTSQSSNTESRMYKVDSPYMTAYGESLANTIENMYKKSESRIVKYENARMKERQTVQKKRVSPYKVYL